MSIDATNRTGLVTKMRLINRHDFFLLPLVFPFSLLLAPFESSPPPPLSAPLESSGPPPFGAFFEDPAAPVLALEDLRDFVFRDDATMG